MASKFCAECGKDLNEIGTCANCTRLPAGHAEVMSQKSGYFSLQGRISRKDYWLLYFLPLLAASMIASGLDHVILPDQRPMIGPLVSVLSIFPWLAGGVKRAHDRNRSGRFLLLGLIPVVGSIWVFIELCLLRGTRGSNRFGNDPVVASVPMNALPA